MSSITESIKTDIILATENHGTLGYRQLLFIYQKHFPKARKASAIDSISRIALDLDKGGQVIAEFDKHGNVNQIRNKTNGTE